MQMADIYINGDLNETRKFYTDIVLKIRILQFLKMAPPGGIMQKRIVKRFGRYHGRNKERIKRVLENLKEYGLVELTMDPKWIPLPG